MIPLKDDNPTSRKPVITFYLIGICVFIFLIELSSTSYRTGTFLRLDAILFGTIVAHYYEIIKKFRYNLLTVFFLLFIYFSNFRFCNYILNPFMCLFT